MTTEPHCDNCKRLREALDGMLAERELLLQTMQHIVDRGRHALGGFRTDAEFAEMFAKSGLLPERRKHGKAKR